MKPVPEITLLPRTFHVRTPAAKPDRKAYMRAWRQRARARHARREAWIRANGLSAAEAAYLPASFDPAALTERPQ